MAASTREMIDRLNGTTDPPGIGRTAVTSGALRNTCTRSLSVCLSVPSGTACLQPQREDYASVVWSSSNHYVYVTTLWLNAHCACVTSYDTASSPQTLCSVAGNRNYSHGHKQQYSHASKCISDRSWLSNSGTNKNILTI